VVRPRRDGRAGNRRDVGSSRPAVRYGPVSFLSDYGLEDEFVGIVHRVMAARAPGVPVIDITHQVPVHDVRAGALTLWRAAPWLAPGVILAVVDPGVGTARRAVAVEVASAGAVLVGPDNGLLFPAASSLGAVTAAVELSGSPAVADGRGATFAGRDLFAPACAALAHGCDLGRLGRHIDPDSLVTTAVPVPGIGPDGAVRAEVLWVDRFGNVQLNAGPGDAGHLGSGVDLRAGTDRWTARRAEAYADLAETEIGLVTDSYGLLSVSCRDASAAARTGLAVGDEVWLLPAAGG
jgi:S-adenosylmethionine hydrolase